MKRLQVYGKYGEGYTLISDDDYEQCKGKRLYAKPNGYIFSKSRKMENLKIFTCTDF